MAARILEVCDAVADRLRADNPGLAVERVYVADLDPPPAARTVYVAPGGYGQPEGPATRIADAASFRVLVTVAAGVSVPPDPAAVDALVAFAQERVYDPLSDARAFPTLPAPCAGLWPQAAEVVSVYDPDELRRGLFVCDLAFEFHGIE